MNATDVNELIALPYAEDGFGPEEFNCWGLLLYVQRHYFDTVMPIAPLGDSDACLALFDGQVHTGAWKKVLEPIHGCGALLREGAEPHVGVYLDLDGGGILHALRGVGVTWTPMALLRKHGYHRATFYRICHDSQP